MSEKSFETIVIGGGLIGSGAVCHETLRGNNDVLLLEKYKIGHPNGASDDHSRIIRNAQHSPIYARLVRAAFETWHEVESHTNEQLVVRTGGLDLDTDMQYLQAVADSMEAAGTPYEWLDTAEVMKRWPFTIRPEDNMHCLFQAESGLVNARRAINAHIRLARDNGATILEDTPAQSIQLNGSSVIVSTTEGDYEAEKLIIAADARTNELLAPLGRQLPLTVTQEQVVYYNTPHLKKFAPERFPIWLLHEGKGEHYYAFPAYGEPVPATKAGIDLGGQVVTADTRSFEPDARITNSLEAMLKRFIPDFLGPIQYQKTCLYTLTPDRDLVIDTLPDHPNVAVVIGAGHAAKYASLLGRISTQLIRGETPPYPIESFGLDRSALTDPTFKPTWHFGSTVEHEPKD